MDTDPAPPTPAPPAAIQTPVFVRPEKNMVLALLLTFFLGSLGMLYATIPGASSSRWLAGQSCF
ncbi:hypothetical protein ACFP81_08665 [Deinococcus lacus]|uniref:Uncharacterized protein n=1 Tax=Deinococcus lacus TaxID=392561 RepID=A0ABW1YCV4_9DEIO